MRAKIKATLIAFAAVALGTIGILNLTLATASAKPPAPYTPAWEDTPATRTLIPAGQSATITDYCPAGKVAISDTYFLDHNPDLRVVQYASNAVGQTPVGAWQVEIINTGTTDTTVQTSALCANA